MSTENFKQQQQDRIEEGKDLKREDELRDLSQIPVQNLPGGQNQSFLSKVGAGLSNVAAGISNVAGAISEKVGLSEGPIEGHEELDRSVRRQVKKVNKEIHEYAAENGLAVEQVNDWENNSLPKQVKKEVEGENNEAKGAAGKGGNNQSENVNQAEKQSLLSKIGAGISNTATNIVETVNPPVVEGHEELDRSVRRQVKKVNEEIRQYASDNHLGPNQINDWENNSLTKQVKNQVEGAKNEAGDIVNKVSGKIDEIKDSGNLSSKTTIQPNRDGPSPIDKINNQYDAVASKVEQAVDQVTSTESAPKTSIVGKVKDSISQGVGNIKQKIAGQKEEEINHDGTKHYRTVKDGINENVSDVQHEKRVQELGGQELNSKNPFQVLSSGNDDDGENRTLGEKIKGGISDASQKISSTVGGATQKVKSAFVHKQANAEDKENAQQIA